MTFAFGHLVGAWLLGKLYEKLSKKELSRYAWFFLLFGAILPDADFLIDWTFGTEIHRTITHSLLFALALPLLFYGTVRHLRLAEPRHVSLALGAGILSHLLLDVLVPSQGIPLFWPSLLHISTTHVGYFDPAAPSFIQGSASTLRRTIKFMIFDMALGTAWIFWLWWRKKISF